MIDIRADILSWELIIRLPFIFDWYLLTISNDYMILFSLSRVALPKAWSDRLDDFQKIIFLKCLRPDKVTNAMQDFVSNNLGQKFIEPQVCQKMNSFIMNLTVDWHIGIVDLNRKKPKFFFDNWLIMSMENERILIMKNKKNAAFFFVIFIDSRFTSRFSWFISNDTAHFRSIGWYRSGGWFV